MSKNKKILFSVGTRPEAIKVVPLIHRLIDNPLVDVKLCITGQHKELLNQVLDVFSLIPDYDLGIMSRTQTLDYISESIFKFFPEILKKFQPDVVLVHGDTTSALIAGLCCFYNHIPVGHIEAGLRSDNKKMPFPEEINRQLLSRIAEFNFSPTEQAKTNLLKEGIEESTVFVTGNTIVDAVYMVLRLGKGMSYKAQEKKNVLVTIHHRENWGSPLVEICKQIKELASQKNIHILWPLHPNPKIKDLVTDMLKDTKEIELIDPLDYPSFIQTMNDCDLIITDSSGIQEEAMILSKTSLIVREQTERPEILCDNIILVEPNEIFSAALKLIEKNTSSIKYANEIGNGTAAQQIEEILLSNKI